MPRHEYNLDDPRDYLEYEKHLKAGNRTQALVHFMQLHTDVSIDRGARFAAKFFVEPVIRDGLNEFEDSRTVIRQLEAHVLLGVLHGPHAERFEVEDALDVARLGLKDLGRLMFLRSSPVNQPADILVKAEALLGRSFDLRELMGYAWRQPLRESIGALCHLYLTRDDVLLPVNCSSSVRADRDCSFGDRVTAEMVVGLAPVFKLTPDASKAKQRELIWELLDSSLPEQRLQVEEALGRELGRAQVKKAIEEHDPIAHLQKPVKRYRDSEHAL